MIEKIWKFLNSPLIIVATIMLGVYFMMAPKIYTPEDLGGLAVLPKSVGSGPLPSRISMSSTSIGDSSYFGYYGSNKYQSKLPAAKVIKVGAIDIENHEPPLAPGKVVGLAREMLGKEFPELQKMKLKSVSLESALGDEYYVYVVHFNDASSESPVGMRVVVLLDGSVVVPSVSSNSEGAN